MQENGPKNLQNQDFKSGIVEPLVLPNGRGAYLMGHPGIIIKLLLASEDNTATRADVLRAVYGPKPSKSQEGSLKHSLYRANQAIGPEYSIVHRFRAVGNGSKDGTREAFLQFVDLGREGRVFYSNDKIAEAVGRKNDAALRNLISRVIRDLGVEPDGRKGRSNSYSEEKFSLIVGEIIRRINARPDRRDNIKRTRGQETSRDGSNDSLPISLASKSSQNEQSIFNTQIWGPEVPFLGQRLTYDILSQISRGRWDKSSKESITEIFRKSDRYDYAIFEERIRRGIKEGTVDFSEARLESFITEIFFKQLEKSWDTDLSNLAGKERDIVEIIGMCKRQGVKLINVVEIVCEHFVVEIPEKYKQDEDVEFLPWPLLDFSL